MKTYDEVTKHILSTARSRRRKHRQIQYAASVSVVCAACIMGLGVYMQLEKPPTAPIQKETFTSTVSEAASGSPAEFPETITAEQPAPPEESGSMTDQPEPSAYASETPGTDSPKYTSEEVIVGTVFPSTSGMFPPGSSEEEELAPEPPHTDLPETTALAFTDCVATEHVETMTLPVTQAEFTQMGGMSPPTECPPSTEGPLPESPTESPFPSTNALLDPTESPTTRSEADHVNYLLSLLPSTIPVPDQSGKLYFTETLYWTLYELYTYYPYALSDAWKAFVEEYIL